jgi:hypothetical protein
MHIWRTLEEGLFRHVRQQTLVDEIAMDVVIAERNAIEGSAHRCMPAALIMLHALLIAGQQLISHRPGGAHA